MNRQEANDRIRELQGEIEKLEDVVLEEDMSLARAISNAAEGELIEYVVIGGQIDLHEIIDDCKVQPWDMARGALEEFGGDRPWRDYNLPNGRTPHAFWAWSASWVLHLDVYDGHARVARVPRHPMNGVPDSCGGGF